MKRFIALSAMLLIASIAFAQNRIVPSKIQAGVLPASIDYGTSEYFINTATPEIAFTVVYWEVDDTNPANASVIASTDVTAWTHSIYGGTLRADTVFDASLAGRYQCAATWTPEGYRTPLTITEWCEVDKTDDSLAALHSIVASSLVVRASAYQVSASPIDRDSVGFTTHLYPGDRAISDVLCIVKEKAVFSATDYSLSTQFQATVFDYNHDASPAILQQSWDTPLFASHVECASHVQDNAIPNGSGAVMVLKK